MNVQKAGRGRTDTRRRGRSRAEAATLRRVISAAPSAASRLAGPGADGQSGLPLRWALPAGPGPAAWPWPRRSRRRLGIWPLAAVGPALLTVSLAGRSLRGSFLAGLVFGVVFFSS